MEHTPTYWKTFYIIQELLMSNNIDKYQPNSIHNKKLQIDSHKLTEKVHKNYV